MKASGWWLVKTTAARRSTLSSTNAGGHARPRVAGRRARRAPQLAAEEKRHDDAR